MGNCLITRPNKFIGIDTSNSLQTKGFSWTEFSWTATQNCWAICAWGNNSNPFLYIDNVKINIGSQQGDVQNQITVPLIKGQTIKLTGYNWIAIWGTKCA